MRNKITTAKIVAVLCVVFLFSFFSVPFAKADWPMFHVDSSHSGVGSGPSVLTFTKLWSYTTGGLVESSPAVVNGVVYVTRDSGSLFALNAASGLLIWNYTAGNDWLTSPPTVSGGVIYVGSAGNRVYALEASSSSQIWNFTTIGEVDSCPAVANGIVYVGAEDGNTVYALNTANGDQIWNYTTGNVIDSSQLLLTASFT